MCCGVLCAECIVWCVMLLLCVMVVGELCGCGVCCLRWCVGVLKCVLRLVCWCVRFCSVRYGSDHSVPARSVPFVPGR